MGIQQTVKVNIRDFLASALSLTGLTSFSRLEPSSLTILTFHRVLPSDLRAEYPSPGLVITPDELHWVLSIAKEYFDINTLSDAYKLSHHEDRRKPQLAITFDDGQWDNHEFGLPVLTEIGVPGTFYIPTAFIGENELLWHDEAGFAWQQLGGSRKKVLTDLSPGVLSDEVFNSASGFLQYLKKLDVSERGEFISRLKYFGIKVPAWSRLMNWSEIKHLHELGHEIGSHARTHNLLSQLSLEEQRKELDQSMIDIADSLGVLPSSFCYPDGNYDGVTLSLLDESQYETAVTTKWGVNYTTHDNYQLKRCNIDSQYLHNKAGILSKSRFQFRLSRYHPDI